MGHCTSLNEMGAGVMFLDNLFVHLKLMGVIVWACAVYYNAKRSITYDIKPRVRMYKPDSYVLWNDDFNKKCEMDDTKD